MDESGNVGLPKEELRHLVRVRRAQAGTKFLGLHPDGRLYMCLLEKGEGGWACRILEEIDEKRESPLKVTLAQAMIKKDKFEWVIQKAVELGIMRIVPLITARSEVRLSYDRVEKRMERWNRILREAVKQCGRATIPVLSPPIEMSCFISELDTTAKVVLDESGGEPLRKTLVDLSGVTDLTLFVGPEGGWDELDRRLFEAHHATCVHLGPRILRAETAPVAALAILQYQLGDLS